MMSPQTPRNEPTETDLDADERALAEALRAVPVPEPSAELDARILAMAATAMAGSSRADSTTAVPVSLANLRSRRRSRWGWGMGAAAAAVLSALVLAPHWLDRSGVAPSFDAGNELNHVAPAAPSEAPMAEVADRLQPDRATNAAKTEAVPSAVAPTAVAQPIVEAEPMAAAAPSTAEQAPPAPKPQRQIPASPATIDPTMPMLAPAPSPVIADPGEGDVEAVVVGEVQPKEVEHSAVSRADGQTSHEELDDHSEQLRQREEVPIGDVGSSGSAASTDRASKPRSNETALTSEPTALPATATVDPAIVQIRQLIADKQTERALAAIAIWQKRHPAMPLPDDIQQWWQAQAR